MEVYWPYSYAFFVFSDVNSVLVHKQVCVCGGGGGGGGVDNMAGV